jgi:hypothetical protein
MRNQKQAIYTQYKLLGAGLNQIRVIHFKTRFSVIGAPVSAPTPKPVSLYLLQQRTLPQYLPFFSFIFKLMEI